MAREKRETAPTLPVVAPVVPGHDQRHGIAKLVVLLVICFLTVLDLFKRWSFADLGRLEDLKKSSGDLCPQESPLEPSKDRELWENLTKLYNTDEFLHKAVNWLGGAVQIPTESYDKMAPVGEDPRWEIFGDFHKYLLRAYPLVHSTMTLSTVNTYGLIYEWKGTNTSLKPLLLAAHQDVVPVDSETVDQWDFPPFSGAFDGKRVYGRGSSDDKSGLIGILSAIETLVSKRWSPTRTVVLAFGFDEEVSGIYGAQTLAKALLERYGEDSFALLVDEGGEFGEQYGGIFAIPAVGEKGYIDVRVEVSSPGGHSSIPPSHTSIGILSALLVHYEANPYRVRVDRSTPIYHTLQCLAAHAPGIPADLRKTIKKSAHSQKALHALENDVLNDRMLRSFVGTTQAIDLISGGVMSNALPEQAWAVVNHRIATQSSVAEVKAHDTALLEHLASEFNLSYSAFGREIYNNEDAKLGSLVLTDAWGTALEPAPITPIAGDDATPFRLLSGTIKATYNAHRHNQAGEEIQVAPGIMSGNTDTRYYWNLTKHIFRYNHHNAGSTTGLAGVHTVNESIDVDSFLEMITFFTTLILNADESTSI